jgi:chromate transporter
MYDNSINQEEVKIDVNTDYNKFNKESLRLLIDYYIIFFKIGLFTIGGGYVMIPVMERELVEGKNWITEEQMLNSYALAQSIPGIIAVNTSAFLGYKLAKTKGAVATCLGVITPSIIIISLISLVYTKLATYKLVANAFKGIRLAVIALLLMTVYRMIIKSISDIYGVILASTAFLALFLFNISAIIVIVVGAVLSFIIYFKRSGYNGTP